MTWIYSCPDCDRDLGDEDGFGLWCCACERYYDLRMFDDPDDERDRMIDDRDGAHVA